MKFIDHIAPIGRCIAAQIPDALMIAGALAVSYGVGLVHVPAGWIVAGSFLLTAGWLLARGSR